MNSKGIKDLKNSMEVASAVRPSSAFLQPSLIQPSLRIKDPFGRVFPYLRLSLTTACTFRCQYCLPHGPPAIGGGPGSSHSSDFGKLKSVANPSATPLKLHEIENLVSAFQSLGVRKVRLTGGEPLLRKDIISIVKAIHALPGIENIAITTNGERLNDLLDSLLTAGLGSINLSIDSLRENIFQQITQTTESFATIINSVDRILEKKVIKRSDIDLKINTVLLKGVNEHTLDDFLEWGKHRSITWRWIELMKTKSQSEFFKQHYLSADVVKNFFLERGWRALPKDDCSGPAQNYYHPDFKARVGIIAPYSKDFCSTCNRLRVSAQGHLKLCLMGEGSLDLRPLLQSSDQRNELISLIQSHLLIKPKAHQLLQGIGSEFPLAQWGG